MSAPRPALCPPGDVQLNRMGRRLQKGGEALHDDVIALARRRLQAWTVENLHFPPAILDEAGFPQRLRGKRHRLATDAHHRGQKLVRVDQVFGIGPIMHHEEPAGHPL
jgi:hypothetical protein